MFWKAIAGIAGTAGLGLAVAAGWFIIHLIQAQPIAKVQVQQAQATAQEAKGQGDLNTHAAQTVTNTVTQLQPIIQREKETERAIQSAPGSDVLVDPRSAGPFYSGMCAQPWRGNDPVCGTYSAGGPGAETALPASAAAP